MSSIFDLIVCVCVCKGVDKYCKSLLVADKKTNYTCAILLFRNSQRVCSRDSLSHNDCCHPGLACLFGIHRCLLVESKDGRHHYAAHSSTAKIRAGRLVDSSERKSKTPQETAAVLLFS